jgi:uncharacterized protein YkwD
MKNKLTYIACIITFLAIFPAVSHGASNFDPIAPSDVETEILAMINEARVNPLETAKSMGLDPDTILSNLPELHEILTNGLPPLTYNGNLFLSAQKQAQAVLDNDLLARSSLKGTGVYSRLLEKGYISKETGEAVASIAFRNFMKPEEAAKTLFNQIFKDELKPTKADRVILNPDLETVGVSLKSGRVTISKTLLNAYVLVADFATNLLSPREQALTELFNQARGNPLGVAKSLGMDPKTLVEGLPDLKELLEEGLPPLGFNDKLYDSADAHALDMAENSYFSKVNLDGFTVEDRIKNQGYGPVAVGEILGSLASVGFIVPEDIAKILFESSFKGELNPASEERFLLNPDLKEMGLRFSIKGLENGDGLYTARYLLVADFGARDADLDPVLSGTVWNDLDGNGLYNGCCEGLYNIQIRIEGPDTALDLFTGSAGTFAVPLKPGLYRVIAHLPEEILVGEVALEDVNAAIRFMVAPEEEEAESEGQ